MKNKALLASFLVVVFSALYPASYCHSSQETLKALYLLLEKQSAQLKTGLRNLERQTTGLEKGDVKDIVNELDKAGKILRSDQGSFELKNKKTMTVFLDQFGEVYDELNDLLDNFEKNSDQYLERFLRRGLDDDNDALRSKRLLLSGEVGELAGEDPLSLETSAYRVVREYIRIRELAQWIARYQILNDAGYRLKLLLNAADSYLGYLSAAAYHGDRQLVETRITAYKTLLAEILQVHETQEKMDKSLAVRLEMFPEKHGRFLLMLSSLSGQGAGVFRETLHFLDNLAGTGKPAFRKRLPLR